MAKMVLIIMVLFGIVASGSIVFRSLSSLEKKLVKSILFESIIYGLITAGILIGVVILF